MTFSTWAEAEAALTAVHGSMTLPGSSHPLTVKWADAKPAEIAKFDSKKRGAWDMMGMGMMGGMMNPMMGMGGGGGKRGRGGMVRAGAGALRGACCLLSRRLQQVALHLAELAGAGVLLTPTLHPSSAPYAVHPPSSLSEPHDEPHDEPYDDGG